MNTIKVKFNDWSVQDMKNWLIHHIGHFKYTIGDVLYHDIGDGWQLYIKVPPIESKVYWVVEIYDEEKAAAFKLRFL